MAPDLRTEIQQTKPFKSLYEEALLNLLRTSSVLEDRLEQLLRPYDITSTQYNVLRILRGSEPVGLCRNELRDRMLSRMPDVTRLLDRMEEAGLVVRTRSTADRRQVGTRITQAGLTLLDELDDVVTAEQERQLSHLDRTQLKTLIDLLTLARRD